MLKFITTVVVGAALLVGTQATSEAGHGRCGGSAYYAAPAYPAAATYQAAAPGGYRSFSYQPGSYQPGAAAYRGSTMRSSTRGASFENATSKALGRFGN